MNLDVVMQHAKTVQWLKPCTSRWIGLLDAIA